MSEDPRAVGPVDRIIARNLLRIRHEKKISQTRLAEAIGVTFQQVQKMETAQNRIAASRLYYAAKALGVPVGSLFDGA